MSVSVITSLSLLYQANAKINDIEGWIDQDSSNDENDENDNVGNNNNYPDGTAISSSYGVELEYSRDEYDLEISKLWWIAHESSPASQHKSVLGSLKPWMTPPDQCFTTCISISPKHESSPASQHKSVLGSLKPWMTPPDQCFTTCISISPKHESSPASQHKSVLGSLKPWMTPPDQCFTTCISISPKVK
ncbi:hypothetical protein BCR41DRAFT_426416 [Lobosporangium transversale]|uniref:Uncharacterized protein n=1 Tax=Lobosporangium transversale TaxID=64571 RepID=A0A1Y2G760_9FUNG|nr:hypothetical protein BCR41DRAFT_426416 [Lobosporangium transversale]ORY99709.1 hypothetical protein BCR41DRAFT_426416 [Lobosporangium transversale]|eukprot:XP_021875973.1 hypothetical protein BCR41DRAFT_426416 [Lobosporangium transversale]